MNGMRLRGLVRKETYEILRDPSSIAIAFVLPLALLLIFGYGVSLDARRIPVAEVVDHPSQLTASYLAELERSAWFHPTVYPDPASAEQALLDGRADAILWLRSDFTRLSYFGGAPIGLVVNGVDANQARIIRNYVNGTWLAWLQEEAIRKGAPLAVPVVANTRVWFNPALRSRDYLIPGLIAIIMTLIGALLTALVVAREWERGTMEGIMVTPVNRAEILLGKLVPYFVMGMGGMILSTAMAVFLFDVPLRGSLWVLLGAAALFLLTALGMGLVISVLARSQFVAAMLAIVTTFLPAFILSGFLFDIRSMPRVIQLLTHVVAARYFVAMLQSIFLAGDVWPVILRNAMGLAVLCMFFLGIALLRFRKRLD